MAAGLIGVLFLLGIAWVANDAARRGRSGFGWAFLVASTTLIGAALWFFVRRGSPVLRAGPGALRIALVTLAASALNGVFALLIATFIFQIMRNEGPAMEPTFKSQDRLIVSRLAYRFGSPRRGDVVVFRYPPSPDKLFMKRIIAVDGDTVRSVDGRVYVNDVAVEETYVLDKTRSHDTWGPQVIRGYFVLGDNRSNSADSRIFGVVPAEYVVGRVSLRWWPIPDARLF